MYICPNCGKTLEDGTKICGNCGVLIVEQVFCHNCGKQTSVEYDFCRYCGAARITEQEAKTPKTRKKRNGAKLSETLIKTAKAWGNKLKVLFNKFCKMFPNKMYMIGAGAVAALLIFIIVLSVALSSGAKNNCVLYLKDKEMFFSKVGKIKPWQVTAKLVDSSGVENQNLANSASSIGSYVHVSEDGKKIFFVDKIGSNGMALYYRSATNSRKSAVKIDSNVDAFDISKDGNTLVYLKGEAGDLYIHNLKEKEKLATGVSDFAVSEDAKTIIWMDNEFNIYAKRGNKEAMQLDTLVDDIERISDDFKTIWYTKENSLYKMVLGKDAVELVSGIHSVLAVYESDVFYYLKSSTAQYALYDYVEDDLAESDAAMVKPVRPKAPDDVYQWNFATEDEYNAAKAEYEKAFEAYQKDYEEYEKAQEDWHGKEARDVIRENLKNNKHEVTTYSLYYNNGNEDKELTTAYEYGTAEYSFDHEIFIYGVSKKTQVAKLKISEISSYEDVSNMVNTAGKAAAAYFIAIDDNVSEVKETAAERFWITDDGKAVYFLDDVDHTDEEGKEAEYPHGDLYKMTISGKNVKRTTLYDSDVYSSRISLYTEDKESKLLYYKSFANENGELYLDKEKIADDVRNYSYHMENNTITCMTEWNAEKSYGTLKQWKQGKLTTIADDVHSYVLTPEGQVLYLTEYNLNNYKGDLYIYNRGKKSKKVDDDVIAIVPVYLSV